MLEAKVEKNGDGVALRVGLSQLPLPRETLTDRPALAGYAGKTIAVGIRPEALDESSSRNGDGGSLRGIVRAVEALGPEQLAHIEVEAKPVLAEDVVEGLAATVEEATELVEVRSGETEGDHALLVARLDASASVRPDDVVDLAVDLRKLHFFDLESGETIRS
jgi:multiple sugar transport system ATP-binding protein